VSFEHPDQIGMVAEICQSFVLDNGAFSHWKQGMGVIDIDAYEEWIEEWSLHPGFDWCLIPDVIDGSELDNIDLIKDWISRNASIKHQSVPVWHLHESLGWLHEMAFNLGLKRIAIGSSGDYSVPGSDEWEFRMSEVMDVICDAEGRPRVKVHGLRMMDPKLFSRYPFSSVDSCNVARNIGIDKQWESFKYAGQISKAVRGDIIAHRIESHAAASVWVKCHQESQGLLFE
jgi:hypothetical protein